MKPSRKIINMDYRNQTAVTTGMFAENHWPRDDETIAHELQRSERRAKYKREQSTSDSPVHLFDKNDLNTLHAQQGRRCW